MEDEKITHGETNRCRERTKGMFSYQGGGRSTEKRNMPTSLGPPRSTLDGSVHLGRPPATVAKAVQSHRHEGGRRKRHPQCQALRSLGSRAVSTPWSPLTGPFRDGSQPAGQHHPGSAPPWVCGPNHITLIHNPASLLRDRLLPLPMPPLASPKPPWSTQAMPHSTPCP